MKEVTTDIDDPLIESTSVVSSSVVSPSAGAKETTAEAIVEDGTLDNSTYPVSDEEKVNNVPTLDENPANKDSVRTGVESSPKKRLSYLLTDDTSRTQNNGERHVPLKKPKNDVGNEQISKQAILKELTPPQSHSNVAFPELNLKNISTDPLQHIQKLRQLKSAHDELELANQNLLFTSYLQNIQLQPSMTGQSQPSSSASNIPNLRSTMSKDPATSLENSKRLSELKDKINNSEKPLPKLVNPLPHKVTRIVPLFGSTPERTSSDANFFSQRKEGDIEDIVDDAQNMDHMSDDNANRGQDVGTTIDTPIVNSAVNFSEANKLRFNINDQSGNVSTIRLPLSTPNKNPGLEWLQTLGLPNTPVDPPSFPNPASSSSVILNQMLLYNNLNNSLQSSVSGSSLAGGNVTNPYGLPTNIGGVDILSAINMTLNKKNTQQSNPSSFAYGGVPPTNVTAPTTNQGRHTNVLSDGSIQQQLMENANQLSSNTSSGKVFICEHPGCGKTFSRKLNFVSHFKSAHQHQKPFKCETCQQSFARHSDRRRHEKSQHSHVKEYSCGGTLSDGTVWGCAKVFKRKDGLLAHWKSIKAKKKCFENISLPDIKSVFENIERQTVESENHITQQDSNQQG